MIFYTPNDQADSATLFDTAAIPGVGSWYCGDLSSEDTFTANRNRLCGGLAEESVRAAQRTLKGPCTSGRKSRLSIILFEIPIFISEVMRKSCLAPGLHYTYIILYGGITQSDLPSRSDLAKRNRIVILPTPTSGGKDIH